MNQLYPFNPLESSYVTVPVKAKRIRNHPSYQGIAVEILLKLSFNVVLVAAAVSAWIKLMPYQIVQQDKLQEVHQEVKAAETRVNQLRENFGNNFDPYQTKRVMQAQSPRVEPNKHRIIFLENKTTTKEQQLAIRQEQAKER